MSERTIETVEGTTPRFRRRHTVLAEQFDLTSDRPWPFGVVKLGTREAGDPEHLIGYHWIPTRNGPRRVRHGNWIVRDRDGLYFQLPAFKFIEEFEPLSGAGAIRVQTESIDAAFVRLERDDCGVKLTIESEDADTSVYLSTAALRKIQGWESAVSDPARFTPAAKGKACGSADQDFSSTAKARSARGK